MKNLNGQKDLRQKNLTAEDLKMKIESANIHLTGSHSSSPLDLSFSSERSHGRLRMSLGFVAALLVSQFVGSRQSKADSPSAPVVPVAGKQVSDDLYKERIQAWVRKNPEFIHLALAMRGAVNSEFSNRPGSSNVEDIFREGVLKSMQS
ncbi:MAG: hypothetical protein KDD56_10210, partial [Bdellovibrionales bacterium]|nr:hypothetical protein [Bdellovibrionales bacterium]